MFKHVRNWIFAILALLFAGLQITANTAVVYTITHYLDTLIYIYHIAIALGTAFAFFLCFFLNQRMRTLPKALCIIFVPLAYDLCWALPIGFHNYTAGIVISCVIMIVCSLFLFGQRAGKKRVFSAVATALIVATLSTVFYFAKEIKLAIRRSEVPLTQAGTETLMPHAKAASKIYIYSWEECSTSNLAFLESVQGYMSLTSDEQIFLRTEYRTATEDSWLATMAKYYDTEQIVVDTKDELLDAVAGKIKNYVLCDASDNESLTVGLSLCNQMDAVLVPEDQLCYAEKYGWKQVFNAIGKDKNWLVESEYFDNLNKDFMIVFTGYTSNESHFDYALLANAWFVTQFDSVDELAGYCEKMNRGFYIWGIRGSAISENAFVRTVADYSGTYFYSWGMENVSVLTGFRLENIKTGGVSSLKREVVTSGTTKTEGKHTVCFIFSDGDNFEYICENNIVNDRLYASNSRSESLPTTSGMSGLVIENMPLVLLSYYDYLYPNESLVMQLGSIGYTYPSKWNDEDAFAEVIKALIHSMEVADIHTVEIMDDIAFMNALDINCTFDCMQKYFDMYTAHDVVDGCFYISYQSCYDGFNGEVCWSNDKPVVSARYSIWNDNAGNETNDLDYIANQINSASRDTSSEDSYSFIIVHAWSGIDENGNLIDGGDCMGAVAKLSSMFADDVDVVNADEFIARMKANVER